MATSKFPIQMVTDNKEKGISYKENFKRYNKAKASEFYLECLWILYAMIEDRTSSFLYYIGFTSEKNRAAVTGTKKIKKEIREILGMEQPNAKYKFDTISGKLTRIKELSVWSKMNHETLSDYQQAIVQAIQPVADSLEFENALNYLESEWRVKRNQLTHSLFNKNPDAVLAELLLLVENGYTAARQLDISVRKIKKQAFAQNLKYNNMHYKRENGRLKNLPFLISIFYKYTHIVLTFKSFSVIIYSVGRLLARTQNRVFFNQEA